MEDPVQLMILMIINLNFGIVWQITNLVVTDATNSIYDLCTSQIVPICHCEQKLGNSLEISWMKKYSNKYYKL